MYSAHDNQGRQRRKPKRKQNSIKEKSAHELWLESLYRAETGFKPISRTLDTFSSNRPSDTDMPYLSTPNYLRVAVGAEKPKNRTSGFENGRVGSGSPAYKTPEEYYDDVIDLRKQIAAISNENSMLKTKVRKLEEGNLRKEREIEQLLDPSKSEAVRRTLADRKPDSNTMIQSLKQKSLKVEQQLKMKEAAFQKLENDVKTTKIEEMKIQIEAYYQEILRLRNVQSEVKEMPQTRSASKESAAKIKALNETIHRINESKIKLESENRELKVDLAKALTRLSDQKERTKDYDDLSKRQLMEAVSRLEEKLSKANQRENELLQNTADKQRNGLLQEELQRLRDQIKKQKESKENLRGKYENRGREIQRLQTECDRLRDEMKVYKQKIDESDKSSIAGSPRRSSMRPGSASSKTAGDRVKFSKGAKDDLEDKKRRKKAEQLRENHAATTIQRGWKSHRSSETQKDDEAVDMIQSSLRGYDARNRSLSRKRGISSSNAHEDEDNELETDDEDNTFLQSALRGHSSRYRATSQIENSDDRLEEDAYMFSDDNNDLIDIQSSLRGHQSRSRGLQTDDKNSQIDDNDINSLASTLRGHSSRRQALRVVESR